MQTGMNSISGEGPAGEKPEGTREPVWSEQEAQRVEYSSTERRQGARWSRALIKDYYSG